MHPFPFPLLLPNPPMYLLPLLSFKFMVFFFNCCYTPACACEHTLKHMNTAYSVWIILLIGMVPGLSIWCSLTRRCALPQGRWVLLSNLLFLVRDSSLLGSTPLSTVAFLLLSLFCSLSGCRVGDTLNVASDISRRHRFTANPVALALTVFLPPLCIDPQQEWWYRCTRCTGLHSAFWLIVFFLCHVLSLL